MSIRDVPNFSDLYTVGKIELLIKQPNLAGLQGDVTDFILSAGAAIGEHTATFAWNRIKALYLDGASGDDLTVLVNDHWNIQRFPANAATTTLTLSRLVGGTSGTITAGTVFSTRADFTGVTYTFSTDIDVSFGTSTLTVTVPATATATGPAYNVAANTIVIAVSPLFDSSITVTNLAGTAGGTDAETDENLRNRARNYPSTIRRGTLSALKYGAEQVNGVTQANVVEELDPLTQDITGIVDVFISDANGNSSDTLVAAVKTELDNWRCAGIVINVFGAQLLDLLTALGETLNISLTIRIGSGVSVAVIQDNVKAAVAARINRLNVGDILSADIIKQAILNVDLDNILGCTVNVTTLVPLSNQVIRTNVSEIVVS